MASDLIVSVVLGTDGRHHLRWREAATATPCPTCFPEEGRRE